MASQQYTEIEEFDQANNLVATYIQSLSGEKKSRIDVIVPKNSHSHARSLLNAFLPAGYPHSVTSDYLEYQIYDSLQAFSSSIAGMLSSRAVLEGLGVGDASSSPTSALLLSVLQESMGRIATILFAHRLGTSLEPECKMYRLAADIFNDAAMVLDCLSPAFPRGVRVGILGGSSCLRALCGVAAGSSKASLSAHFATQGNLGELNAKDSSQETIISLMGMLVGSLVVSHISSKWATWTALLFLLAIHLGTNYLAVRAVCMRTLSRQRANLVFDEVLCGLPLVHGFIDPSNRKYENEDITIASWPTPQSVSKEEKVFERDGVLRIRGKCVGYCQVGVSLQCIIDAISREHKSIYAPELKLVLKVFRDEKYIVWYDKFSRLYLIVLKEGAVSKDILMAWMLVMLMEHVKWNTIGEGEDTISKLEKCRKFIGRSREVVFENLEKEGWDLDVGALETRSGCRIRIKESSTA